EVEDCSFSRGEIVDINNRNIDIFELFKLLSLIKQLQYKYAESTKISDNILGTGFLHLEESVRNNIVRECLNRNQSDKYEEYLLKVLQTIKSTDTLTLGTKIIDLIVSSDLIPKEKLLNEIYLNCNQAYSERLITYY